jgi:F-type H+-transporting ATPase subunit epsilon
MEKLLMHLKILLPFRVFTETNNVSNMTIETSEGSYGMLPQRLDCVAALVPGIFTYEIESEGPHYVAIDAGIMIKAGTMVLVSVRNAIGGANLGLLADTVKKTFEQQDETETKVRSITGNLESRFIYSFDKFRRQ